jgi:hypothetical protein
MFLSLANALRMIRFGMHLCGKSPVPEHSAFQLEWMWPDQNRPIAFKAPYFPVQEPFNARGCHENAVWEILA